MTDKKYNGWTNWETWSTNLNFDDSFSEEAQECYNEAEAKDNFSREDNAAFTLADRIKETVEELTLEDTSYNQQSSFVKDILNGFFSSVNYHEIAKNYIAEVDKEESEAA